MAMECMPPQLRFVCVSPSFFMMHAKMHSIFSISTKEWPQVKTSCIGTAPGNQQQFFADNDKGENVQMMTNIVNGKNPKESMKVVWKVLIWHNTPHFLPFCAVFLSDCSIEIITCTDPKTGKPTQKIVKSVVDPDSGNVYKMVTEIPEDQSGNVQVVTRQDPVTGETVQEIVTVMVDPETGETVQVPADIPMGTCHFTYYINSQSNIQTYSNRWSTSTCPTC